MADPGSPDAALKGCNFRGRRVDFRFLIVCNDRMDSVDDHERFEAMVLRLPDQHRRVLSVVLSKVEQLERDGEADSAHRLLEQILRIVQGRESPS